MADWSAPVALSDAEWALVAPLLSPPHRVGRPRTRPRRVLLDAMFYLVRTGCQWRLLPREYPPWQTVYHYWRAWRLDGTWARLHAAVRDHVRVAAGREVHPSAGILDTQSVKTPSAPVSAAPAGMTGARTSRGASAMSWSTPKAGCCACASIPPTCRIARASPCSWTAPPQPFPRCTRSGLTRATPATPVVAPPTGGAGSSSTWGGP
jgi:transposase